MQQTSRPNVRWGQHGQIQDVTGVGWGPAQSLSEAVPADAPGARLVATLIVMAAVLALASWPSWMPVVSGIWGISDFWWGVLIGGVAAGALGLGLLAIGVCLGAGRISEDRTR